MAQAAAQRVGYANGGPVEAPADDDTVYPTTAPKWDMLSPEAAMMGASVGYARGGTVQSNDINHRAALLAGLRKRYDAMIAMAQGAHAHGDIKTAAHLASKAHDMVPDGKNLTHNVTPDGHILSVVHGRGGVESTHPMTSQQFHHYLVGPATSFDHVIDNGVGHNLHIASGRQQPRVQEHPNDPIHRVRQVLQHTRQMHGLHRIGQQQAPAPTGYAAGGPVRGYDDGGTVDDDQTIDPTLLSSGTPAPTEDDYGVSDYVQQQRAQQAAQAAADQERQSAQRASDVGSDDPLMRGLTQRYRPVNRPADRTTGFAADPDAPITSDSSMGALLKKAAEEKWARNQANAPESASIPGAISSAWGSIKQKLADYINGANAAPPHEVDAAMAATQAANPTASTAEVVQKTIAGTADPLSPNYMDQAGQDALGGLGRSTTAGQAPAQTGYAQQGPSLQTYTGPQGEQRTGPNTLTAPSTVQPYQVVNPPETRQEIMARGFDEKTADRIMNAGDPKDPFTQALSQYVPTGLLDSPEVRKDLQSILGQGGGYARGGAERAAADAYASQRGGEVSDYGPNVPMVQQMPSNHFATDRENLTRIAQQLVDKANARNSTTVPGEPSTGLGKTTDTKTGQVTYPNTAVGRANQAADQARARGENPLYDTDDIRRGTPLNMPQAAPPSSRSAPARAPARVPAARAPARRSDAGDDTGVPGPQLAVADTGTMSDASNDVRSTLPAAPQGVGYAQANQPPSAGGFSGAAGDNVTTIPVRQGAPTPAGTAPATPATSAAPPTYPQGYKLVPATPAQGTVSDYDRAVVGPDGKVVNYVRKGDTPPRSDVVMNKVYGDNYNNNREDFFQRLQAGEPTGINLNQYLRQGYDFSKPLPPRQASTAESMADRDTAIRQNVIHDPSGSRVPLGDPVQDLLRRAAQTSDVNAQRMFTNEAYKIQETRRVNQQKSADAALKTFSTGEQNLIKSIYTKENGGNKLTDAEQALKDDYVTRIQQHTRSQQGGGQAAARAPTAQSTGAPVRVSSPAQARSLPSGTRIILPDGSPGVVP